MADVPEAPPPGAAPGPSGPARSAKSGRHSAEARAARCEAAGAGETPRGAGASRRLAALVFDFDGLILDTETCTYETTAGIFAEHGQTLDLAWWHSIIGTANHPHWSEVLADRLGRPVDRAVLVARREARRLRVIDALPPCDGVVELLDAAVADGIPTAVASSSGLDWVDGHLERLGLRSRFSAVVTRDDLGGAEGRTKPAPDLFLIAAERLGVEPARCLAFEDSPNGVAAARAAGMVVVGVPGPMTAELDFGAADLVVPSLAETDLPALRKLVAR